MPRKKKLSEQDLWEIVKFKEYIGDMQIMKREPFFRKYQEYMGLSNEELERILAKESQ